MDMDEQTGEMAVDGAAPPGASAGDQGYEERLEYKWQTCTAESPSKQVQILEEAVEVGIESGLKIAEVLRRIPKPDLADSEVLSGPQLKNWFAEVREWCPL